MSSIWMYIYLSTWNTFLFKSHLSTAPYLHYILSPHSDQTPHFLHVLSTMATTKIPHIDNNDEKGIKSPTRRHLAPPSIYAIGLTNAVAYAGIGAGAALLLAPVFTGKLLQLAIKGNSLESTAMRLFGGSTLVLGELLWFVRPRLGEDGIQRPKNSEEQQQLRRVLWASAAVDSIDVAVLAFAAAQGSIPKTPAILIGGVTSSLVVASLFALKNL
jgi:hypothetical protein